MRVALALIGLLAAASAQAHDLWLEKAGKHFTLYQGHRHSAHAGAGMLDYGKRFVTSATCLDARGAKRPLAVAGTAPWTASGDCAALLLEMSSGYWSKTPWETRNAPKTEVPGAFRSWLSKDSLKRLDQWAAPFAQPLGDGLELVPASDPFALKPGEMLVVRVLLAGQPVSGAPVAYQGDSRGTTDPDGRIAIRLRHAGVQLISTQIERPLGDGKADLEILGASLQFELPK